MRLPGRQRRSRRLVWLLAALALPACPEAQPRPAQPANLVLIVSDALRADALDCYGGSARTPHICGLARDGALFENAYSNASWTLPAAVAMFSGRHPRQFSKPSATGPRNVLRIDDEELLLAEALRASGYEVVANIENSLAARGNTLQGFARVPTATAGAVEEVRRQLGFDGVDERYVLLESTLVHLVRSSFQPFLLLHWFRDPHAVYSPPEEFLETFEYDPAQLPQPLEYYRRLSNRDDPERGSIGLPKKAPDLSLQERDVLKRLYETEVESVDQRVGFIVEALALRGRLDDTFVVFTADHGEGFGEHRLFLHGTSHYDEMIRIPLIVRGPGIPAGRRIAALTSLVDLIPTLAELLGVDSLPRGDGVSLAALLREPETPPSPRSLYIDDAGRRTRPRTLIEGRYKLISRRRGLELYDRELDPGEARNLAEEQRDLAQTLDERLTRLLEDVETRRTARRGGDDPALIERERRETLEAMRAIGYIE